VRESRLDEVARRIQGIFDRGAPCLGAFALDLAAGGSWTDAQKSQSDLGVQMNPPEPRFQDAAPAPQSDEPGGQADTGRTRGRHPLLTTSHIATLKLASQFFTAGAVVLTARYLTPADRGRMTLAVTLASLGLLFTCLNIGVPARAYLVAQPPRLTLGVYISTSLVLIAFQAILCLLGGIFFLPLVKAPVDTADLVPLGLYGAFALASYLAFDAISAFGLVRKAAVADAFGSAAQLAASIAVVLSRTSSVGPFLWTFAVGAIAQVWLSWVFLGSCQSRRPVWAPRQSLELARVGVKATTVTLGVQGIYRVDRYFVGALRNAAAVGIYSVAASAAEFVRLIPYSANQLMYYRQTTGLASHKEVARFRAATLVATLLASGAAAWLAPTLIVHVIGSDYAGAVTPLRILLIPEVFIASFLTDSTTLLARVAVVRASVATGIGLAITLVADVLLISRHGIVGAAWASVVGYAALAVCTRMALRNAKKTPEPTK
jgi:O-antigen/teichoic acid export membrane protein